MLNKNFNLRFKKILNDLKRRPEDAASDLGISKKEINQIMKEIMEMNKYNKMIKLNKSINNQNRIK